MLRLEHTLQGRYGAKAAELQQAVAAAVQEAQTLQGQEESMLARRAQERSINDKTCALQELERRINEGGEEAAAWLRRQGTLEEVAEKVRDLAAKGQQLTHSVAEKEKERVAACVALEAALEEISHLRACGEAEQARTVVAVQDEIQRVRESVRAFLSGRHAAVMAVESQVEDITCKISLLLRNFSQENLAEAEVETAKQNLAAKDAELAAKDADLERKAQAMRELLRQLGELGDTLAAKEIELAGTNAEVMELRGRVGEDSGGNRAPIVAEETEANTIRRTGKNLSEWVDGEPDGSGGNVMAESGEAFSWFVPHLFIFWLVD